MPFIADEEIQKTQEKINVQEKISKIKENHKINNVVKKEEEASYKPSDAEMIQLIGKQQKEPKQITPADIEKSIKVHQMMEDIRQEEIKNIVQDNEIKEVKDELIGVLALPMTIPERRRIFHAKLKESQTISDYLNENVLFRWFNKANSHVKFTTIYGIKYLQTLSEYQQLQHIQKLQKAHFEKLQKEKEESEKPIRKE